MMANAWDTIRDSFAVGLSSFTSPDKRLFVGYLLFAAFLACWVFVRSGRKGSVLRYLFNPRVWWSRSARLDYKLVAFNSFVKVLLIGQYLVGGVYISLWFDEFLREQLGASEGLLGPGATVLAYTLTLTILGDFSVYVVHRLMHSVPALWAFHKVHHSATTLSPVTQLRLHPVELVINNIRSIVVFGFVMGAFRYVSNHQVEVFTFVGVNVFSFLFFAFGANLRHSHVRLPYWHWLEHILVSPLQHQVHHSDAPCHHHRNFGSKLALWDWFFGTLVTSRGVGRLRFGLGEDSTSHETLTEALIEPFTDAVPLNIDEETSLGSRDGAC